MFSALLVVCTLDYSDCKGQINPNLFESEEQCHYALGDGYAMFEENNLIVVAYDCYKWNLEDDA